MRIGIVTKLRSRMDDDLEVGPSGGVRRKQREARVVEADGFDWVCAVARSGAEFCVADDLADIGFEVFAPHAVRAYTPRLPGGKRGRRFRSVPVFAPYVFVGQPPGLALAKRSHPWLIDVIANEAGPLKVPPAFIRAACDLWLAGEWDARRARARPARFVKGAEVRPLRGPFEGLCAIVADMPSRDRACVEIVLFGGRPTRLTLDADDLALV